MSCHILVCVCRPGLNAAQIRSRVSDAFRSSATVDGGDLSPVSSSAGSATAPNVQFGGALTSALGSSLTPPTLVSTWLLYSDTCYIVTHACAASFG